MVTNIDTSDSYRIFLEFTVADASYKYAHCLTLVTCTPNQIVFNNIATLLNARDF